MGPTPSSNKKIREDIAQSMEMWTDYEPWKRSEGNGYKGYIRRDNNGEVIEFKSLRDGEWYDISKADMSHKNARFEAELWENAKVYESGHMDAVEYWNTTGKYTGARSDEVRAYMENPDNYYFELASYNRSDGGQDGNGNRLTYDAPEPNGTPEADSGDNCKN